MGWGHFSTPLAIVAAEVPAKPDPPLTTIDNVNVRVSWTKPYQNSSPITAYEIMIQKADESFVLETELCDGSQEPIFSQQYCDIPMSILRQEYKLELSTVVKAKFRAQNIYGWGVWSEANTVGA